MRLYISWKSQKKWTLKISVCNTKLFRSAVLLPETLSMISIHGQRQGSLVHGILALLDKYNKVYLTWRHLFSSTVTLVPFPWEAKPSKHFFPFPHFSQLLNPSTGLTPMRQRARSLKGQFSQWILWELVGRSLQRLFKKKPPTEERAQKTLVLPIAWQHLANQAVSARPQHPLHFRLTAPRAVSHQVGML